MELPKNYDAHLREKYWGEYWEKANVYAFDPDDTNREIFSVDTPPPTVSGKMHLGHSFSYSQQDFVIRYKRMKGYNVFYPFGTDDNGLPTERLVESINKVRSKSMKREDFIKLCLETLEKIRPDFVQDWKNMGISCDFSIFYSTINDHCRKISQKSFIDLYKVGRGYRKDSPSLWCPECQTGVAQVDLEDKELDSQFNDIVFKTENEDLIIATTRPELLSSCVAVFFNPDDSRYKHLKGKSAIVPIFNHKVPVLADPRASLEKGTGLVMCCTFGDQTDIEWYKAHNLPLKTSITSDGKMTDLAGKYAGMKISEARKAIIVDLKEAGKLISQKPIRHSVNVHERCGTPIEIMHSKQWYIKYLDLMEQFEKNGLEMIWYPDYMKSRLTNWINGIQWDWCISRQRHYGIPFPVWYCAKCEEIIVAEYSQLPVDPTDSMPPVDKCPKCGSIKFIPEKDVMDTWATSSLTPQITVELMKGKQCYKSLFPMDLRPQAHDIITFWLFNTMVKSQIHYGKNPWKNIMISGWALDPKGKKMSKSKGNVIAPQDMMIKYSADCIRYWAGCSKLGEDLAFQEKDLQNGKKMTTKMWNALKFSYMHLQDFKYEKHELEVMDKWMLTKLQKLIVKCTDAFDSYEYSKAKAETENFFWNTFCDYYLEIIKDRVYNPDKYHKGARESAQFGLYESTLNILKLLAPIMPYITEELYQLYYAEKEGKKSIHVTSFPIVDKDYIDETSENAGDHAVDIIGYVRKFKSENQMSLKDEISQIVIECDEYTRKLIELVIKDIMATTASKDIEFNKAENVVNEKVKVAVKR
ncbi:MAG: valine--tRNA ligase [archaeon]